MQKCFYCGQENEDAATSCGGCGSLLTERQPPLSRLLPGQMLREIQQGFWDHFAVKRRQFYLAGLLIGAFGGVIGAIRHLEYGFPFWLIPVGGTIGVIAVWLLSSVEWLEARFNQARAKRDPKSAQRLLYILYGLIALVVVALLVAAVCAYFL